MLRVKISDISDTRQLSTTIYLAFWSSIHYTVAY